MSAIAVELTLPKSTIDKFYCDKNNFHIKFVDYQVEFKWITIIIYKLKYIKIEW